LENKSESMKILVVSNLFHPDRGGAASVFSDLCYGLVERGHQVSVYTTYPYYPEWRNKSGLSPWRMRHENIEGVDVYRYGLYIPKNPSALFPRIAYELSFTLSLLRSIPRTQRFDAVMVFCPLAGAVVYAALRTALFREPLWLNVQDIPADAAAASGISQSRLFNRIGETVQRRLFNRAAIWSTIAPAMVSRLETIRSKNQPILYCPNFLNSSMAEEIAQRKPKTGRPPGQPLKLLYAGNIGKKQGLIDVCKALAETPAEFDFRIQGNGGEAQAIRTWVSETGDRRFRFGEFLEEKPFIDALFETDLFVITEKPGVGASFIPSKLIPCMATGTPVLCICDREGPLGIEVEQYRLGCSLPWPEIHRLHEVLEGLFRDHAQWTAMQQSAIERAKFFDRSTVIDTIEDELARWCKQSSSEK
jgi:colanic acid biosynthesis glycosyl transferase WcaI